MSPSTLYSNEAIFIGTYRDQTMPVIEHFKLESLFNVVEYPQDREESDLVWVLNMVWIPNISNKAAITPGQ